MTRMTFLASALALSACVYSAAAEPQVSVSYSDLDISRPAGAEVLLGRIKTAARMVCGHADIRDLSAFRRQNACMAEAIEGAIRTVRSPLLAQLYGKPQLYADAPRVNIAAR